MPRTGLTAAELHARALDVAEEEIRRVGAGRLRLTDVARRLELSHAALYKHFRDKESLLDAISERWLHRVEAELGRIAEKEKKTAQVRLNEWFLTLHRLKREKVSLDPELYRAFDMAAEKARPFVLAHLETSFAQLERIVADGMAEGYLRCRTASRGALILFEGTMAFHHPRLVLDRILEDRVPALKAVLKTLLAGMSLKDSRPKRRGS